MCLLLRRAFRYMVCITMMQERILLHDSGTSVQLHTALCTLRFEYCSTSPHQLAQGLRGLPAQYMYRMRTNTLTNIEKRNVKGGPQCMRGG